MNVTVAAIPPSEIQIKHPEPHDFLYHSLTISLGLTTTYQAMAEGIGSPKVQYAVGKACKANPIPCYRVIGKNDRLIGTRLLYKKERLFRW